MSSEKRPFKAGPRAGDLDAGDNRSGNRRKARGLPWKPG
jgi:hypothetical protein